MLDMRQLLIFSFLFLSCSNFEDDIIVTTPNQFHNNSDEETNDEFDNSDLSLGILDTTTNTTVISESNISSSNAIPNTDFELSEDILDVEVESGVIYISGYGFVAKSTDGGNTFENLLSDNEKVFQNIEFYDELRGYVAQNNQLLYTSDGGLNWENISEKINIDLGESDGLKTIFDLEIEGEGVFILCGSHTYSNSDLEFIFSSDLANDSDDYLGNSIIFKLDFFNKYNKGVIGYSWQNIRGFQNIEVVTDKINITSLEGIIQVDLTKFENGRFYQPKFFIGHGIQGKSITLDINEDFGVSITPEGFYHITTDGGDSWTQKQMPILSDIYFLDLLITDDKIVYSVGQNGHMIVSSDLGRSFEQIDLNTDKDLRVIKSYGNNSYIIAGEDGYFKIVEDISRSLSAQSNNNPNYEITTDIYDVEIESGVIYVSGDGYVARSTDGGATFENLISNNEKIFQNIEFFDSERGYVAQEDMLFYTSDGGFSWITVESNTTTGFGGIYDIEIEGESVFILSDYRSFSPYSSIFNSSGNNYDSTDNYRRYIGGKGVFFKKDFNSEFDYGSPLGYYNEYRNLTNIKVVGSKITSTYQNGIIQMDLDKFDSRGFNGIKGYGGDGIEGGSITLDINEDFGVSITPEGFYHITTDGGDSWTQKQMPILSDIYFLDLLITDDKIVYSVGQNGHMIVSSDLGRSFEQIDLNTDKDLRVIKSYGNNSYIIAGEDGYFKIVDL